MIRRLHKTEFLKTSMPATPAATSDGCLLEVKQLSKAFKGLLAVDGYSLELRQGEILGIIGPNGAGKTTVFNLLTGYLRPTTGTIRFAEHDITHRLPDHIAALGVGRTFQNIRLFSSMTVLENVKAAQQLHDRDNLVTTLLTWPTFRARETRLAQESLEQLALFDLADRADQPAISLPYGDQRRLEIVRALALRPRLLLLDEPTAGMSPHESMEVLQLIRQIRERYDLTIIIVEHNMPVIMQLSDRIQALNYGQIIAEGKPEEIRGNPGVIEAYLGKPD
jgi:branched-chain amino acid transport system ATP-binding protein